MNTQTERPIDENELDELMAQLENETLGAVAPPAAAPAAAPDEANEAELAVAAMAAPSPVADAPEMPAPPVAAAAVAAAPEMPAPPVAAAPEPAPAVAAEPAAPAQIAPVGAVLPALPEPNPLPAAPAPALQFHVDVQAFRDETRISEHNLDECMMKQAGLRAYYGEQAARSEAQHARIKMRFEVLEATLYDKHRKALSLLTDKVTEKAVENAVKLDPRWARAKSTVIEAETIASINRTLVDSMRDRKDMIVQLGADRRDEYKGALRTMASEDAHSTLAGRALAAARPPSAAAA